MIKNCPCCGKEVETYIHTFSGGELELEVYCDKCGIKKKNSTQTRNHTITTLQVFIENFIASWNQRSEA